MSALALGAAIGAGKIDPVELARHFDARIASADPDKRVYLARTSERAQA